MIYCPECQTANRDGSNFCNNCGATLEGGDEVDRELPSPDTPPELEDLKDDNPWLFDSSHHDTDEAAEPELPKSSGSSNILEGLQGTLAAEPWIDRLGLRQPGWEGSGPSPVVGSLDPLSMDQLELLAQPATSESLMEPERPWRQRPWRRGPTRFLYLILLLALLLALLRAPESVSSGVVSAASLSAPPITGAWKAVSSLDSNSIVLVAWDFDPSTNGEMSLIADALVTSLLAQRVRLVTLSLLPAGPPLAQAEIARMIDQLAAEYGVLSATQPEPLSLGYVPGGDIALRAVSLDPLQASSAAPPPGAPERQLQAMQQSLRNLSGVDLLLVLTAEADDGRAWIEQVTSYVLVPTVIGASAAAAPGLLPYFDSRQIDGLVGGYDGALAFGALSLGQSTVEAACALGTAAPAACSTAHPQFWGQVILLLALLLGILASLVTWARGERP